MKRSKGGQSDIFHKSDLILGSITDSRFADILLDRLISEIKLKEAALRRINNGKVKAKMAHTNGTVKKVVANSRHSVVTSDHLA